MLQTPFRWTDHAIDLMRRMIAEGHSSSQIGSALGCSRGAVIGKASRMQIPLAKTNRPTGWAVHSEAQRIASRRRRLATAATRDPQELDVFAVDPDQVVEALPRKPKTIIEGLVSRDCRWPMGKSDGEQTFCCEETVSGCSRCPEHRARVFVPRASGSAPIMVRRARA